jgi:hypothetical protein
MRWQKGESESQAPLSGDGNSSQPGAISNGRLSCVVLRKNAQPCKKAVPDYLLVGAAEEVRRDALPTAGQRRESGSKDRPADLQPSNRQRKLPPPWASITSHQAGLPQPGPNPNMKKLAQNEPICFTQKPFAFSGHEQTNTAPNQGRAPHAAKLRDEPEESSRGNRCGFEKKGR